MRRITQRRGTVAALEDDNAVVDPAIPTPVDPTVVDPVEVPPVVEPIGDNAESLETDLIEVADDLTGAEQEAAETEEAVEVVEALESIRDSLAISAANGGLDRHAAAAIGTATDYMYKRVGMGKKSMLSLESFGGTTSRVGATQLTMEALTEDIKKIWASIIAAFEKAIQWAKDFYTKVFVSYEKLGKRAEELSKKATDIKGEMGEKEIENARLVKSLNVDGKVGSEIIEGAKQLITVAKSLAGANNAAEAEKIAGVLEASKTDEEFLGKFELESNAAFVPEGSDVSNPEEAGFAAPKEGLTIVRGKELPGGRAIVGRVNKEVLKGKAAVAAVGGATGRGVTLGAFNSKAAEVTAKAVPTLNKENAIAVANAVSEIAKAGTEYKSKIDAVTVAKKKLVEASKKVANGTDGVKSAKTVASSLASTIDQPAASINVYMLNTGKALLDYVEESLKQFKAE